VELLALRLESQQPEEHWVIADLVGNASHVRTVPIPTWVNTAVDAWTSAAAIADGPVFRTINKAGRVWGEGMCSGMSSARRYLGCKQKRRIAVNEPVGDRT
jgi:hypothetical protein